MVERLKLVPDESHPIVITPTNSRVDVKFNGQNIVETDRALTLKEASYPEVQYIPIQDVAAGILTKTNHKTYCPYKGECSYFDVTAGDRRAEDAAWTYESPYEAVSQIKEHVAFYPDRVDSIEL